jgi:hypothetical protein
MGHSVRIADRHYFLPTPEMERNHKFVGEALERARECDAHRPKRNPDHREHLSVDAETRMPATLPPRTGAPAWTS